MKRIIIFGMIIVTLLLVGCVENAYVSEKEQISKEPINEELTEQAISEEVEETIVEEITEENPLNDCFSKIDETPGESYVQYNQDICRLEIAKETKNKKLCSGIKNENKKSECDDFFDELPFVEGTATREDILDKCKCTSYCYGVKYKTKCINENVRNPTQCLSFIGLHYATDFEGTKQYIESANGCLRVLMEKQSDVCFCDEYPDIYSELCKEIENDNVKKGLFRVKSVIDGETIELMTGEKVRLIGLAAPNEGEPYYEESKERLKELLALKSGCYDYGSVSLEKENGYGDKDIHGNLLRYVYGGTGYDWKASEGGMVNMIMVYEGWAKWYGYDYNVAHNSGLMRDMENRQGGVKGLWQNPEEKPLDSQSISEEIDYIVCSKPSGGAYSCDDLNTQVAQIIFESCDGIHYYLDNDGNGIACDE